MKVTVQHFDGYNAVRVSGAPGLDEFMDLIRHIAEESRAWPQRLLLVDLREVTSIRTFTEQFSIGEEAGRRLKHLRRIASVVPEDRITRTSEKAARHTGVELRVFTSEAEAVQWLLSP